MFCVLHAFSRYSLGVAFTKSTFPIFAARLNMGPDVVRPDVVVGHSLVYRTNIRSKPVSLRIYPSFCSLLKNLSRVVHDFFGKVSTLQFTIFDGTIRHLINTHFTISPCFERLVKLLVIFFPKMWGTHWFALQRFEFGSLLWHETCLF